MELSNNYLGKRRKGHSTLIAIKEVIIQNCIMFAYSKTPTNIGRRGCLQKLEEHKNKDSTDVNMEPVSNQVIPENEFMITK